MAYSTAFSAVRNVRSVSLFLFSSYLRSSAKEISTFLHSLVQKCSIVLISVVLEGSFVAWSSIYTALLHFLTGKKKPKPNQPKLKNTQQKNHTYKLAVYKRLRLKPVSLECHLKSWLSFCVQVQPSSSIQWIQQGCWIENPAGDCKSQYNSEKVESILFLLWLGETKRKMLHLRYEC